MHDFFTEVMLPYVIGGTLLGLTFAIAAFYITKPLIVGFRKLRRKNMAKKAKKKQPEG